jgi:DNA-binding NarL/FixJ family response regulator
MNLKVLIVDDHEVARIGLADLLKSFGFLVSAAVASGEEAVSLLRANSIDVVLLDIRMPDNDGLATLELVKETDADLAVVILSAYENPTYVARAAALGADDYILKNGAPKTIYESLHRAGTGKTPPPDSELTKIRRTMCGEVDVSTLHKELPLTGREAQVLRHVALGLSNKEIARSLSISVETVKEHVQNILRKMKANDRTDAAVRSIKLGILDC